MSVRAGCCQAAGAAAPAGPRSKEMDMELTGMSLLRCTSVSLVQMRTSKPAGPWHQKTLDMAHAAEHAREQGSKNTQQEAVSGYR